MAVAAGIEDINIYAGPWAVRFADIARERGFAKRLSDSAGFEARSVLPPYEDLVTLAVNAAQPLVERSGPDSFGLLIVATESSVDSGKPISTYIHRHLGIDESCKTFDIKHACYGGAVGLRMAACWVQSANAAGRKALLVTTDAARRHFGHPAELAGGAGAVALAVSTAPALASLEEQSGAASFEVYDVARPTPTGEIGDPALSLHTYLDLMERAWQVYADRANVAPDPCAPFSRFVYHAPLIPLVQRAHDILLADRSREERAESFARQVRPGLAYNLQLANIYSGSVFVSLAAQLRSVAVDPGGDGARIAMFAYGSGACAEWSSLQVGPHAWSALAERNVANGLLERRFLSVPEYERAVVSLERSLTEPDFEPDAGLAPPAPGLLALRSVKGHRREYVRS